MPSKTNLKIAEESNLQEIFVGNKNLICIFDGICKNASIAFFPKSIQLHRPAFSSIDFKKSILLSNKFQKNIEVTKEKFVTGHGG